MSIVLDNLDPKTEEFLRQRAAEFQEELAVVIARLLRGAMEPIEPSLEGEELRKYLMSLPPRRDLSAIVGKWEEDPEFDAAIASCRQIEPDMWK